MREICNNRGKKTEDKGKLLYLFESYHQLSSYRKRVHCYYCKQWNRHHQRLCPQQFGTVQRENSSLAEELPEDNEVLNTENSLISSRQMVLMQTAKADVQNTVNGLRQNARILLDLGSQRTYITESLAKSFKPGRQG